METLTFSNWIYSGDYVGYCVHYNEYIFGACMNTPVWEMVHLLLVQRHNNLVHDVWVEWWFFIRGKKQQNYDALQMLNLIIHVIESYNMFQNASRDQLLYMQLNLTPSNECSWILSKLLLCNVAGKIILWDTILSICLILPKSLTYLFIVVI